MVYELERVCNGLLWLYFYVPDEGSLLPKYRDCTTSNDFELYLMCCGVMLLLLIIYIYIEREIKIN